MVCGHPLFSEPVLLSRRSSQPGRVGSQCPEFRSGQWLLHPSQQEPSPKAGSCNTLPSMQLAGQKDQAPVSGRDWQPERGLQHQNRMRGELKQQTLLLGRAAS